MYPWENIYTNSNSEYVIQQKPKSSTSGWSSCGSSYDEDTAISLMEDKRDREPDKSFRIKCGNRIVAYS